METQLDLTMSKPEKKQKKKITKYEHDKNEEAGEAHRLFKIYKSGKPWRFSDKERKLLKDYYGIKP